MKAIQLKAYGSPVEYTNVVEINDIGAIKNDEVIIEVLYSPVNPSDLLLANGTYPIHPELPAVIGGEGVGRVISVGSAVTTVKPGDIVTIPFGTFAWSEKVVAKAAELIVLPANVDLQQAAMLSINPPTAVLLLEEFVSLNSGDWIVFNAANASVSHTIIAVAKSKGIKTLGIVRRKEAVEIALKAGADVVLIDDENVVAEAKKVTNNAEIKLGLDAVGGKATNSIAEIYPPERVKEAIQHTINGGKVLLQFNA